MYSFEPSEEQKMLIDVTSRYAINDLRPIARDADEGEGFSKRLINKGWELGILQASIPEEYGGFGDHSAVTSVLALEELAWGDLAGAMAVMAPGLFVLPVFLVGSDEQKHAYLPDILGADWQPFTAALFEKNYDFDPNALSTIAKREGDKIRISGNKILVPYANEAETMIVYASLDGVTQAFIVPAASAGVSVGERQKLLGINALPLYPVMFVDVVIPAENQLGGQDGHRLEPILQSAWVGMAALAIGLARAAFEFSRDYAKEREAFGVKIAQKQAIAFMLAEMATEIESIRLLTWEAAWMIDTGHPEAYKQAYLTYNGATDMAMMVTDRAVQILGGHGYIREYPVEMWMRNGRGISTFAGLVLA